MNAHALMYELAADSLVWFPELGVGYYPVNPNALPYNEAYFDKYAEMANTPMGAELNRIRCDFVARHYIGRVCDVGIGDGAFLKARANELRGSPLVDTGYDVNPAGVAWLQARRQYRNPTQDRPYALTFWDSFEHIYDPRPFLGSIAPWWVFMSIPTFTGPEHVLRSKHFRKDEHVWYYTADGLRQIMASFGFICVEQNNEETAAGREDILSFAFKRIGISP